MHIEIGEHLLHDRFKHGSRHHAPCIRSLRFINDDQEDDLRILWRHKTHKSGVGAILRIFFKEGLYLLGRPCLSGYFISCRHSSFPCPTLLGRPFEQADHFLGASLLKSLSGPFPVERIRSPLPSRS